MNQLPVDKYDAVIAAPFAGRVGIRVSQDKVLAIDFLPAATPLRAARAGLVARVAANLRGYFRDGGTELDFPHQLNGTEFQIRVWRAMRRIPRGRTLSYGELARRLHSSPRAVGNACRRNPLPLLIPCHRVVAANGLGGFSGKRDGQPLAIKTWLLRHEGAQVGG